MRNVILLLLLFAAFVASAQTKTITGKVINIKGEPVAFATVSVKGTKQSAVANEAGSFAIQASRGETLLIQATNYAQQETTVQSDNDITVTLQLQEGVLNEVVVTAAGIKRSEKAVGYAISKVDPNSLIQKSEPDMLKSLQGKVAGVDIRTSQGTPGAATRIQLRGNSSFFGESQPLIVVDGIPYSNNQVTTSDQSVGGGAYSSGISDLDPNDIASINVLKGSTASALYGSRASNGVLIITTKSGSASRNKKGLEVNYKSSYAFEKISNLPAFQNDYGAGTQFNYSNGSNGSWGAAFRDLDSVPTWPDYLNAYPELFGPNIAYRPYPNNVKDLFKNRECTREFYWL